MRRPLHLLAVGLLLAAAASPVAAIALDRVKETGGCIGGPSTYSLITRRVDADSLRVRVEIRNGVGGQEWSMFVSDNGEKVIRNAKTFDADGVVRWARQTADRAGSDLIEMSAVNRSSGETCTDALTFAES